MIEFGVCVLARNEKVVQRLKVASQEAPNVVRSIAFSPDGKYFAAAGDDKQVYIYDTNEWKLLGAYKSQKKLSCILFTPDCRHVLAANKYGDILSAPIPSGIDSPMHGTMDVIMGHFCSIIMSMSISKIGKPILATTDRDGKVRITTLPEDITDGAHDIMSFCLGHKKFVSACSFVIDSRNNKELIMTGGGDGLIKLWNPENGEELDSVNVLGPVLSMVPSKDESTIFVVLDGSTEILKTLINEQKIHFTRHQIDIPTITGIDVSEDGHVWVSGGPIGHSTGMRHACLRWNQSGMEKLECTSNMKEIENCSVDDQPLHQTHLPEYMEKKARIFNKS